MDHIYAVIAALWNIEYTEIESMRTVSLRQRGKSITISFVRSKELFQSAESQVTVALPGADSVHDFKGQNCMGS